ncbi:MAG: pitrilysin family protein [Pseudomonadota bacterium]
MRATLGLVAVLGLLAPAAAEASIEIVEATSPGGVTFWHAEERTIPMVALEMRFEGGAAIDPEGKAGLARLTMDLMDEGAGERDATAFAAEVDALSMRLGFGAQRDAVSVSARFLLETLEPAAALMAEAIAEPRFDADAIERVRGRALSGIRSGQTNPGTLARDTWYATAFAGHPYARPVSGTEESVASLTREDFVAQRARLMARDKAVIGVIGAIDAEEAGRLVDQLLAGLPAETPVDAAMPAAPETPPPPGLQVVDLDVPQSTAIFGQPGYPREHPDYIPAFIMNYVLGGGGFASRLTTEVREKRGLAYSVSASFGDLAGAPLYLGSVGTENARIAESLSVIRAEWTRMAEEGVSAEELEKAKRFLTGAFPLRFDTNAKIARYMVGAQAAGLGTDYVDIRNGLIEAVTVEDIQRVARDLLQPDALSIVVVGTPEGL